MAAGSSVIVAASACWKICSCSGVRTGSSRSVISIKGGPPGAAGAVVIILSILRGLSAPDCAALAIVATVASAPTPGFARHRRVVA
jgi:hypothetical protein